MVDPAFDSVRESVSKRDIVGYGVSREGFLLWIMKECRKV